MPELLKPPIWFWILAALALLWNGAGMMAFIDQLTLNGDTIAEMPQAKQVVFAGPPLWTMISFGLAVTGGFFGAVFLLMRNNIASSLFILSLIAVLVQFSSHFIVDGYLEYLSGQGWTMPILIPIVAIGLVWFARYCSNRGFLR